MPHTNEATSSSIYFFLFFLLLLPIFLVFPIIVCTTREVADEGGTYAQRSSLILPLFDTKP